MAEEGQMIQAPTGMTLRFDRIDSEVLVMEASYPGGGAMPPEHFHPHQVEHFEVLEGSIRAHIDGTELVYAAGERFDVPAGTPHTMGTDEPTRLRWEVRPALRMAEYFERLFDTGPNGAAASWESFLAQFTDEVQFTAS